MGTYSTTLTHLGRRHTLIGHAITKDRETASLAAVHRRINSLRSAESRSQRAALQCGARRVGGGEHNTLGSTLARSTQTRRRELPYA